MCPYITTSSNWSTSVFEKAQQKRYAIMSEICVSEGKGKTEAKSWGHKLIKEHSLVTA